MPEETKPHGALERKKPSAVNADTAQIVARVSTWVAVGASIVGLTWNAGLTYGRLATVEKGHHELAPMVDKLRMDAAKQEMVNLHSMQQSEQMLRALQRIEARIEELQTRQNKQ